MSKFKVGDEKLYNGEWCKVEIEEVGGWCYVVFKNGEHQLVRAHLLMPFEPTPTETDREREPTQDEVERVKDALIQSERNQGSSLVNSDDYYRVNARAAIAAMNPHESLTVSTISDDKILTGLESLDELIRELNERTSFANYLTAELNAECAKTAELLVVMQDSIKILGDSQISPWVATRRMTAVLAKYAEEKSSAPSAPLS